MIRKYTGKDLARILMYYGLVQTVDKSEFNIVCPFHSDINPSMRIDLSSGEFYCFGCGVFGNSLDFIKLAQPELNDLQACMMLEKIVNSKEVKALNVRYRSKKKKNTRQSLLQAKDYYYGLRCTNWLTERSKEGKAIINYMKQRGVSRKELNIAKGKLNYNIAYPIVFPILDNGRFKGWVCRTIRPEVERRRKYFYNEGFYKRDTLCGTYEKDSIVVLCEGFFDYLNIKTKGQYKNVCALLGWHISDEQINKLKEKNIKTVISALDNDDSGKKGTEYLKKFFQVIPIEFPNNEKDVGEMDRETIRKVIRRARRLAEKL